MRIASIGREPAEFISPPPLLKPAMTRSWVGKRAGPGLRAQAASSRAPGRCRAPLGTAPAASEVLTHDPM